MNPSSTRTEQFVDSLSAPSALVHCKELRSSGTSTAYGRSTARSITSNARAFVEASTTGGAAPAS